MNIHRTFIYFTNIHFSIFIFFDEMSFHVFALYDSKFEVGNVDSRYDKKKLKKLDISQIGESMLSEEL